MPRALTKELWQVSSRTNERPPEIVYHYTTMEGLLGMLGQRGSKVSFRASDARFMNDRGEILAGWGIARPLVRALIEGCRVEQFRPQGAVVTEGMRDFFSDNTKVFVASFSEDFDSLPQWRAYGDDGRGVAIGLRIDDAIEVPNGMDVAFESCVYNPEHIRADLERRVGEMLDICERHLGSDELKTIAQAFGVSVLRECVKASIRVKAAALETEREWRLVAATDPAANILPEHRVTSLGVTPYMTLELEPSRVVEIHLGPGTDPNLGHVGLHSLLSSRGMSNVKLDRSSITYRSR